MILKTRGNFGVACVKGEMGERKQCGMCGSRIGTIGKADEDAIQCGDFFGAGIVGAEEMAGAAGVRDGSGLGGGN